MKTPAVKTYRVINPLYNYALFVRIGGTWQQAHDWFVQKFGPPGAKDASRMGRCKHATTFYAEGEPSHMIWFDDRPGAAIVAHEALHSTVHLMKTIGMGPLCEENEEAFAYLQMWVVAAIGDRLW